MQTIALFGGSFDPPHLAHESVVKEALKIDDVEKVVIMPTFLNPFKLKSYLAPEDRFNLVYDLFKSNNIDISNFEISQNKAVETIKSVKYLKSTYSTNNIYLVIGADNLKSLYLWDSFQELNELVTFVVVSRDGYEEKNDIINAIHIKLNVNISSTTLRENLDLTYIPRKIKKKVVKLWNKELEE